MLFTQLLFRNAFRHKLRTGLTMLGLVVAIMAFGLLNTVIDTWYANAEAASSTRLVTRSAIAMTHPLPINHGQQIRRVDGVTGMTWISWFGGVYKDRREPFAKFAIDESSYFKLFPEYALSTEDQLAFRQDKQGAIIGPKLAQAYGLKVGDAMPIRGDIFPGNWSFTVRGIYHPKDKKADDSLMLVHWQYVSAVMRQRAINQDLAERVGLFVVGIGQSQDAARVARHIDALFHDSAAQTRTETEKSYQLGIVAMSRHILLAIRIVSLALVLIIMAVMANTMMLASHERLREYATLKALGFTPGFIARLLIGESAAIAIMGGLLGMALTYPASATFVASVGSLMDGLAVPTATTLSQIGLIALVAFGSAAWPAWKMSRLQIASGLRGH